ncbi:pyruvate dehydrogenase complex dihydrolipoamide acetyltransferase [Erythrobacter arachoides]|uniref:Acetyltransferase component of pyruvate dehydrogenase complex n=1 Tax=Aurantiacibacter arachoides TaxID=1850444 RepID=A0A845A2L4_9SPHN|nr:pyruvate dehydrogenase complex dihydrolipoamide acetyltransferase [Aurantiacibacter arachoides]MXO93197.1 pyruvate dehydrogenase complex dihydrolipoamide acetyltransferase [Aurantiacibacter arachoides]GGD51264.1 acetyltransferase component of pyruvate dehydrogenase complex [Aurantiacibacter arachoides]
MPIAIKMPALSPTMEEGTLSRWLVKVGDKVSSGDIMAEIETDKATMEFEAVDEGTIAHIQVEEGTEGVKVGTVIATLAEEGEDVGSVEAAGASPAPATKSAEEPVEKARHEEVEGERRRTEEASTGPAATPAPVAAGDRIIASPLARRIAEQKGIDLGSVKGSGPNGRIVKADVEGAKPGAAAAQETPATATPVEREMAPSVPVKPAEAQDFGIPHEVEKLSSMRKIIARRLTESKQTVPHIYLTVDVRLDALLKLRGELNKALEPQGVKLSVNDMLIKALARSLEQVPACNVQFAGDTMLKFSRADISVAVSIPGGLITPIVKDAGGKAMSKISAEMKDLATRAKDGKLAPEEFQGGTASLSNMGMFGIKQFEAVINPPQAMIMAIGAGEPRPYVVDGALQIATVMSATGSFDHRAIDGADGAQLMKVFKELCEAPLGLVA